MHLLGVRVVAGRGYSSVFMSVDCRGVCLDNCGGKASSAAEFVGVAAGTGYSGCVGANGGFLAEQKGHAGLSWE